jgi:hypothetical protein
MQTFRVYEVQYEVIAHKWMCEVEAPNESTAMRLVREGAVDPIDCDTMGEPFYTESGFAVQPHDADSNFGWDAALMDLESIESDCRPKSAHMPTVIDAIEAALNYFEDTRHGKDWIETGGVEAKMLREALNTLRDEGTV